MCPATTLQFSWVQCTSPSSASSHLVTAPLADRSLMPCSPDASLSSSPRRQRGHNMSTTFLMTAQATPSTFRYAILVLLAFSFLFLNLPVVKLTQSTRTEQFYLLQK